MICTLYNDLLSIIAQLNVEVTDWLTAACVSNYIFYAETLVHASCQITSLYYVRK